MKNYSSSINIENQYIIILNLKKGDDCVFLCNF